MITNHAQFIDAIRERKMVRIEFYSVLDSGKVDRECAPLDYGPTPDAQDSENRYWIWDPKGAAGTNPIGLVGGQIISVWILGNDFEPAELALGSRLWSVPRDWALPARANTHVSADL